MGPAAVDTTASDASWENFPARAANLNPDVKKRFHACVYKTHYVRMRDGVRIAVDVLLPCFCSHRVKFNAVFIQCRYMRSIELRWPFKLLTNGLPVDLINQDLKSTLVAAGFAVISCDVRGTGASFGQWRALWSPEERDDAAEMLDWIVQQPWSSGKVVLSGMSYEATAALFALSKGHPAVRGGVLLYPFWDLYNDISCPGGVPQKRFTRNWDAVCQALDKNNVGGVSALLRIFFRGVQPVVDTWKPGKWLYGVREWAVWLRYRWAKIVGHRLLREAVAGHKSFSAIAAANTIRFADEADPQSGLTVTAASACTVASEIATANVPLMLVAGWVDATAAPALSAYVHAAKAPGSQLILGPWTHGGLLDNSVGHTPRGAPSKFNLSAHIVRFLCQSFEPETAAHRSSETAGEHCRNGSTGPRGLEAASVAAHALAPRSLPVQSLMDYTDGGAASPPGKQRQASEPIHFFTMGHMPGWQSSPSWPPPAVAQTVLYLSGCRAEWGASLAVDPPPGPSRFEHVIDSRNCPQGHSRYDAMTDLRRPLSYPDLGGCGHLQFTGEPLQAALQVTGWVEVAVWVESCEQDADLFCYLQSFDPATGSVAYITEGSFRASQRKLGSAREEEPRRFCLPPGLPRHSFRQEDAQPLTPGQAACCHFTLLPTSYRFAPGHCVQLAISGGDGKHFTSDWPSHGSRRLWIHAGHEAPSRIVLPTQACQE